VTDTTVPGYLAGTPDDDYARMIGALRGFLDQLSSARPGPSLVRGIEATLTRWSGDLDQAQVPERERVFGRRADLPGRGQTMSPWLVLDQVDGVAGARGTVRFGRYFLGTNGAVHGGAIPLVFDEVLGRTARTAGPALARTAYLHVNYRSITPADRDLRVTARLVRVSGRKRLVTGEIYDGAVLCCDAEGLFVELRPGQP
jgi:acyl-coenzyme A thioesterase PaaI-like protein